jgi:hypothetical protein
MEMKVKLSIVLSLALIGAALWLYQFNLGRMLPISQEHFGIPEKRNHSFPGNHKLDKN